jgi:hypothetical protein
MTFQEISLYMFALAASGGLLFTLLIALRKHYPRVMVTGHGFLGMCALLVLGYTASFSKAPVPASVWLAIGALGAAWTGGALLFRVLRPKQDRRLLVALMHGSLALLGVFLLCRATF